MKSFFAALALVAAMAAASPVSSPVSSSVSRPVPSASPVTTERKSTSPIQLKLVRTGNTGIKAHFTNCGNSSLKLFTPGTILDSTPVEKLAVYKGNMRIPFEGIRLRLAPPELITNASFRIFQPNETAEFNFNFGKWHDVSQGGHFNVTSMGGIPYATENSTAFEGYLGYNSNTLLIDSVNGTEASIAKRAFEKKAKRTAVQGDCKGTQAQAVADALTHCTNLAKDASRSAMLDKNKTFEFFKTNDDTARKAISAVFTKVANECASRVTAGSVSKLYCTDIYAACKPGVLAYTVPSVALMVNCPLYFTALTPLTKSCHGQDQATTTLHEMTHLVQIKGTLDWGVYGYDGIRKLTSAQNQNHADTYCLFANSVNLGKAC
ncbi:hypothetical protein CkaCkLH20_11941 [Colletotrichum karsti]|uniref:Neutral protease 2 n=1 Tax=Colletotrichum karsti TaxID=1095194 RepID=A0A9P6HV32_9PEZI|nr:uncharacterized protein CkaCkLH20_11941 [Colletotrichum karsti]KAF9870635.1 hypothetical protein CkaCkLH20_11941 [Colletotrichum karsti]